MECVGEYQHQPQELPYLRETLILPKPTPPKRRSEPGSRLYFANSFYWQYLWLFRTLPDAPFSYIINTGCKDSGILSHSKMFCYLFKDSYHFLMFKGFNFIVILCELFVYSKNIRKFAAETK